MLVWLAPAEVPGQPKRDDQTARISAAAGAVARVMAPASSNGVILSVRFLVVISPLPCFPYLLIFINKITRKFP